MKKETGAIGWLCLALFALAYDVIEIKKGNQSLSGAFWAKGKHPYYGPAIAGFWVGLTYHLLLDVPKEYK